MCVGAQFRIFIAVTTSGCWKQLPATWAECDPGLFTCRMVERQINLDLVSIAANFKFDPAGAADATAGADHAGQ